LLVPGGSGCAERGFWKSLGAVPPGARKENRRGRVVAALLPAPPPASFGCLSNPTPAARPMLSGAPRPRNPPGGGAGRRAATTRPRLFSLRAPGGKAPKHVPKRPSAPPEPQGTGKGMAVKRQITLPFASRTDPISGKCGKLPFVENATKVSKEPLVSYRLFSSFIFVSVIRTELEAST
jgi:hypothetical protein